MKIYSWGLIAVLSLLCCFIGIGCSSSGSSSQPSSATASNDAPATQPSRPIPPDSIFAKIKVGMSENEVTATIGAPTTVDVYQTGKAWIPFHNFSGNDNVRKTSHYKGVGTITFSLDSAYGSSFSVMSVDYDPSEPGFAK